MTLLLLKYTSENQLINAGIQVVYCSRVFELNGSGRLTNLCSQVS